MISQLGPRIALEREHGTGGVVKAKRIGRERAARSSCGLESLLSSSFLRPRDEVYSCCPRECLLVPHEACISYESARHPMGHLLKREDWAVSGESPTRPSTAVINGQEQAEPRTSGRKLHLRLCIVMASASTPPSRQSCC